MLNKCKVLQKASSSSPIIYLILLLLYISTACDASYSPLPNSSLIQSQLDLLAKEIDSLQTINIDSSLAKVDQALELINQNNLSDSLKIFFNAQKANLLYYQGKQDEKLALLLQSRLLAEKLGSDGLMAFNSLHLGNHFLIVEQPDIAIPYLEKAASYFQDHPEKTEGKDINYSLGNYYLDTGDFLQAQERFIKAIPQLEAAKDTAKIAFTYAHLAQLYIIQNLFDEALPFTRKGIKLIEATEFSPKYSAALGNLAINYKLIFQDSAKLYYEKTMEMAASNSDSMSLIISLFNYGNILTSLNDLFAARKAFEFVYDFCKRNGINQGIPLSLAGLAEIYKVQKKYQKAIPLFLQTNELLQVFGTKQNIIKTKENLRECYAQIKDIEALATTFTELDQLQAENDSIHLANTINYHNKARLAQATAYQNQLLEQEKENYQNQASLQKTILWFAIFSSFLIGGIMIQLNYIQKSRQQTIKVLLDQHKKELQPHHLTDSQTKQNVYFELIQLFENEQVHLQKDLNVEFALAKLNITYKELSNLLKEEFGMTFPALVNHYRIESAKKMMSNPTFNDLTIEEISERVGFGTRQNFYKIFQKITGVKLSDFRKFISN